MFVNPIFSSRQIVQQQFVLPPLQGASWWRKEWNVKAGKHHVAIAILQIFTHIHTMETYHFSEKL